MLARRGLIGCPCPVPVSLTSSLPSSMTPTLIHFQIRRSTLPSVTRFSIISTSMARTILSKAPPTHYPPPGPSRACHHHSPTTSIGREKTGCFWTTALSRQIAFDPDFAQRRSRIHTQGVDRHRDSLTGSADARPQTPHPSWFHSRLAS